MKRTDASSRLDGGPARISAPRDPATRGFFGRVALLIGLLGIIAAPTVLGSVQVPLGTGSCGTATVDGVLGGGTPPEWDTAHVEASPYDWYAAMYEDGDYGKTNAVVLSDVYLRYDRVHQTAYILVLARTGNTVERNDAWVRLYSAPSGDTPIGFTNFAWVTDPTDSQQTIGYEASFPLGPRGIEIAEVNVRIASGRTSSTGNYHQDPNLAIKLVPPNTCSATRTYGLGNRVWIERNGLPGYQVNADSPIANVAVVVAGQDVGGNATTPVTALTNSDGCYLARNLKAGTYVASIDPNSTANASVLSGLVGLSSQRQTLANTAGTATLAGNDAVTDEVGTGTKDQNGVQATAGAVIVSNEFNLSPTASIPAGEASDAQCPLGDLKDADVNSTADFALKAQNTDPVTVALGNQVWIEQNGVAGYQPGVDTAASGVTLAIHNADGSAVAGQVPVTTGPDGCYLFKNLQPGGTYYVEIPATNFTTGALAGYGAVGNPGGDQTTDDNADQNGRPGTLGSVVSNQFSLTLGGEPANEPGSTCHQDPITDANFNLTADFAFEEKVAVGNLVWIERNGKAGFQVATDKGVTGIADEPKDGVSVELFRLNEDTGEIDAAGQTTTAGGGYFLFDQLSPGLYYLHIPQSMFDVAGAPLYGYEASAVAGGDDAVDDNSDQNGLGNGVGDLVVNGSSTDPFDLLPGTEPTNEAGQTGLTGTSLPDDSVDLTIDFAFVPAGGPGAGLMSIGSTLWIDVNGNAIQDQHWVDLNNNGVHNAGEDRDEPVIQGVQVQVWTAGAAPVKVDSATTDEKGDFRIGALDEGNYQVKIANDAAGIGALNTQLTAYYSNSGNYVGLRPIGAMGKTFLVKALSTLDIAGRSATDSRIDGDDNGQQAYYGQEVVSPVINLTLGAEPVDGAAPADPLNSPVVGREFQQTANSDGYIRDSGTTTEDGNGDMTVDFGFLHQCTVICDITNDGDVTQADIDAITSAATKTVPPKPAGGKGAPHSGDCNPNGVFDGNDSFYCKKLLKD